MKPKYRAAIIAALWTISYIYFRETFSLIIASIFMAVMIICQQIEQIK